MANWFNIAGGAGQGYVQGMEDNQRREEFQSLQRQRQRVEQQQKLDDALTAKLQGVRGEGTFEDYDTTPAPGGMGPPTLNSPIPKKTVRTASDVARERANIYGSSGRLQDLQAATEQQKLAYAADQADSAARVSKARDAFTTAAQLNASGNTIGAARLVAQHANSLPELDGHQLVVQMDANGAPQMAVARNGQFVEPLHPVTQQSMDAMIQRGVDALSPELMQGGRKLGIEQYQAQSGRMTAEAAKKKADFETGAYGQAQIQHLQDEGVYLDRHGRAALMTAQAHLAANPKLTPAQKAKEMTDFYTPLIMQANPGMSEATARQRAAAVALKDPNAKDPKEPNDVLSGSDIVKIQGKYYKPDAKGALQEVRLPGDTKELAAKIAAGLGVSDDGKPSATTPNSVFKAQSMPGVTARPGPAPISDRDIHDWVPQLTGSGRKYKNRMTGEVISQDDFERRTTP